MLDTNPRGVVVEQGPTLWPLAALIPAETLPCLEKEGKKSVSQGHPKPNCQFVGCSPAVQHCQCMALYHIQEYPFQSHVTILWNLSFVQDQNWDPVAHTPTNLHTHTHSRTLQLTKRRVAQLLLTKGSLIRKSPVFNNTRKADQPWNRGCLSWAIFCKIPHKRVASCLLPLSPWYIFYNYRKRSWVYS